MRAYIHSEGTINDDPFGGAFMVEGVVSKVPSPYLNSFLSLSSSVSISLSPSTSRTRVAYYNVIKVVVTAAVVVENDRFT